MEIVEEVKCDYCEYERACEITDDKVDGLIGVCPQCGNEWGWGAMIER